LEREFGEVGWKRKKNTVRGMRFNQAVPLSGKEEEVKRTFK